MLETDGGEFLPESNTILFYLADGTPYSLDGRLERARILRWMFFEQNLRNSQAGGPTGQAKDATAVRPERRVLMPRACTVCDYPERGAIDQALVGNASNRSVASLYDVSEAAVRRHKANQFPAKLVMAQVAEEVAEADSLLDQVRDLQDKALGILAKAEKAWELRTTLGAIREARGDLELRAKLLGELDERPVTNVLVSAQWVSVRTAMMEALVSHLRHGWLLL